MDVYNFPKFNNMAINFIVPSLFSESGFTFNADNVSSQKNCKQEELLVFG